MNRFSLCLGFCSDFSVKFTENHCKRPTPSNSSLIYHILERIRFGMISKSASYFKMLLFSMKEYNVVGHYLANHNRVYNMKQLGAIYFILGRCNNFQFKFYERIMEHGTSIKEWRLWRRENRTMVNDWQPNTAVMKRPV